MHLNWKILHIVNLSKKPSNFNNNIIFNYTKREWVRNCRMCGFLCWERTM